MYIPHSENTTTRVDFDINEYTSSSILYGFDGLAQVLAVTQVETGQTGENYAYGVNRLGYLYDGRGSNAEFRYDPFGAVQSEVGQEPIFGYNGESYNPATELQYLRYRYYSPADGRFQNQDSYLGETNIPLTRNRYAYTGNDPVNRTDPTGEFWEFVALGGAIGFGISLVFGTLQNEPHYCDCIEENKATITIRLTRKLEPLTDIEDLIYYVKSNEESIEEIQSKTYAMSKAASAAADAAAKRARELCEKLENNASNGDDVPAVTPPPTPPPPAPRTPQHGWPVPLIQQEKDKWCWNASAQMIARSYGFQGGTQTEAARATFPGLSDNKLNRVGDYTNINSALNHYTGGKKLTTTRHGPRHLKKVLSIY